MKSIAKLLLIALFPVSLVAQDHFIVAGKVTDMLSREPLQGASVFCQNTTSGTATNAEGGFQLTLKNGGYELVVSFSGYETQTVRISNTMTDIRELSVELLKKEKTMTEISIVATNEVRNGWEKYGDFLKENFIGNTANSKDCVIENPEALRFFFSKKKNQLKVISDTAVIIQNKALGYVIKYQLDSFIHEYNDKKTLYTGFPLFEEMEGSDAEVARWIKNRKKAYEGSVLEFMRSYTEKTLGKAGYKIDILDDETGKTMPVYNPYDTTYFDAIEYGKVGLFFPGQLRVAYSNEKPDPAYLTASKLPKNTPLQISILDIGDGIIIEENGFYYNQRDVLTLGYWAWEKMADFLPYDYSPEEPRKDPPPKVPGVLPVAEPVTEQPVTEGTSAENEN